MTQLPPYEPFDKPPASSLGEALGPVIGKTGSGLSKLVQLVGIGAFLQLVLLAAFGLYFFVIHRSDATKPFSEADQASLDHQIAAWPVVVHTTFDAPPPDYPTGYEDHPYYTLTREITGGHYLWSGDFWKSEGDCCRNFAVWLAPGAITDSFLITADFNKVEGDDSLSYGFIFHYTNWDNFHVARVDDTGHVQVEKWHNGKWTFIFGNTKGHPTIRPYEVNRLMLSVEQSRAMFFVNEQYVMQFKIDPVLEGQVGIVMWPLVEDAGTISIDNITLRLPE